MFNQNPPKIYPGEIEDPILYDHELDIDVAIESSATQVLKVFKQKGGKLIRLDPNSSHKLTLFKNDAVFPACSFGFCRSQTLWALLREYQDSIVLFPPHATRYGFDPYNKKVNWHRSRGDTSFDEFYQWAQIPKCTRFGFDVFGDLWDEPTASDEKLLEIFEYYNRHYYGPTDHPRRVYVTFDKNTHALMHRLNQANEQLEKVIVYHFPFGDKVTHPKPEWETQPRAANAYHQFSLMLYELLDLSHL